MSSNSPDHNAKGTQSGTTQPKPWRRPPTACKHVVSGPLSLPAQGCFSPVPHGTRSLSVTRESLALEGGPPRFTPDPTCRALLRKSTTESALSSRTGLSPSLAPHSRGLRLTSLSASVAPTTPNPQGVRFGLGPFRSPLLRASQLLSLPPGTEMFQFPGFASWLPRMTGIPASRVAPFGTHAVIPRWPNGATRPLATAVIRFSDRKRTQGTETSQYLEEEKSTEMTLVAASERVRAQTSLLVGLGL